MSLSRPCLYSSVHSRDKQRNDMSISNIFHKLLTILSQSPKSSTSIYPIFQTLSHIFQSQPHPSNTDCILRLLSVALGESGGGGCGEDSKQLKSKGYPVLVHPILSQISSSSHCKSNILPAPTWFQSLLP